MKFANVCLLGATVVVVTVAAQDLNEADSICCAQKLRGGLVPESFSDGRLCSSYECPGDYFHNTDLLDQEQCVNGCNVDTCCLTTELYEVYLDSLIPRSNFTIIIEDVFGNSLVGFVTVTNTANADETYTSKNSTNLITVYQGTTNHEIVVVDVDPAYRLIKEDGGDSTLDGTTKKKADKNRTIKFIYELIRYCSEEVGGCGVGEFVQFPSKACVDNTCNECCVPKLCAEFASCDGRKDHTTGDEECTDNVCSNCCGTCYDGLLDKTEECEYKEDIDKWIVPKGSASGTDSGVPDYDFLDATKQCDSDICIIIECTATESWQRICMANSHWIPTEFVHTLDVPKFDVSLVPVDISSIDYHVIGQVAGDMLIEDARAKQEGEIVATTSFASQLKFESSTVGILTVTPKMDEVHLIAPGGSLLLSSKDGEYYAIAQLTGVVDEANYDVFAGATGSSHQVTLTGTSQTTVGGFGMSVTIANNAGGAFRIRYKYNWCPTPLTSARGTFEDHNDACMDMPRDETWADGPSCGDGVQNLELNEECDYLAGTTETLHCSDECTLVGNTCGDGVVWGDEECDYTIDGSIVQDEFATYPPPESSRCRKTTDATGGTHCTIEATICGDGVITDNEDCEYVAGERGQLAPADEGIGYCLDTCDVTPIVDCTTKRVPLCDCDTEVLYTNYVQTAEPSLFGNSICLDMFGNELTFSAGVAEGLNEGSCICVCYNGINDPNEECDVGPEDGSLNSRETCVNCKIVSSYCGDGIVDPLQGEECDRPWSYDPADDKYYEGGTKFCNSKCKLQSVGECEWLEYDTDCRCSSTDTLNGDIETTYKTVLEAQPQGYLGGCPIEPTYRPCECDCVGEFVQRTDNKLDGKPPICLAANNGQCVTQYYFRKTAGVGNWCDHVEGDELAPYLNREGIRSLDGRAYVTADAEKCPSEKCRACEESYTDEKCDQPCGEGNVVGIFKIDVTPGAASAYTYGMGRSLRCSHNADQEGNYAIIPDRERCTGTFPMKTWKRTCNYTESGLTLGGFSFESINTFYRGGETIPDHVEPAAVEPDVKSVTFTSGVVMDADVDIENMGGAAQVFTVTLEATVSQVFKKSASFIADTTTELMEHIHAEGPNSTSSLAPGDSESLAYHFAEPAQTNVYAPADDDFDTFMGTSKNDVRHLMTLAGGDALVEGGGGNSMVTITGTYSTQMVVEFVYDRCDADSATYYNNENAKCTDDVVVEDPVVDVGDVGVV
ncbi:hypothetical protein SARC_05431 [Sphaeroforma arctica JP610]|uniref:TNFR-Cys domain-containing protein n=1 Tax=Sphaeroforma arctica JP610 TaxID=667725 RepID=A0A0L0G0C4_9EUKA|nr:hypothetical protein SARC_05431 [Sphaeroforma arctica JP610]KNC82286.1 hypothetical protein SARC_05431 [Sphaeroforma arctica JP610]|eukprot:XP_014156188.1 hypothetical protein SARC_05431 [Sphaeroforma arctica JP610]